jgi:hypothetical protein
MQILQPGLKAKLAIWAEGKKYLLALVKKMHPGLPETIALRLPECKRGPSVECKDCTSPECKKSTCFYSLLN